MLEFLQWIIGWIQVIPWLVMGASLVAALTPTPVFQAPQQTSAALVRSTWAM